MSARSDDGRECDYRYAVFIKSIKGADNMSDTKKRVPLKYVIIAGVLTVIGTILGWFIRNK